MLTIFISAAFSDCKILSNFLSVLLYKLSRRNTRENKNFLLNKEPSNKRKTRVATFIQFNIFPNTILVFREKISSSSVVRANGC